MCLTAASVDTGLWYVLICLPTGLVPVARRVGCGQKQLCLGFGQSASSCVQLERPSCPSRSAHESFPRFSPQMTAICTAPVSPADPPLLTEVYFWVFPGGTPGSFFLGVSSYHELAKFFHKGPEHWCFKVWESYSCCSAIHLCHVRRKRTTDQTNK